MEVGKYFTLVSMSLVVKRRKLTNPEINYRYFKKNYNDNCQKVGM